jgi:periplasmic divalent cation tolerance protein
MRVLLIHCTCPDLVTAEAIATALVEARLAACVAIGAAQRSVYRWNGAIEQTLEVPLLIKTAADRFDAVRDAILSRHPYELPEIIAVEAVAGLEPYLDWIGASTRPDADA